MNKQDASGDPRKVGFNARWKAGGGQRMKAAKPIPSEQSEPGSLLNTAPFVKLLVGDVIEKLKELPDESVQCVVTSPPYWALRDYSRCDCSFKGAVGGGLRGPEWDGSIRGESTGSRAPDPRNEKEPDPSCPKCKGTGKIEEVANAQIGLEKSVEEWVAKLVEVFREVRRVLRSDGTLWLNLGDSYAGSWGAQGRNGEAPEGKSGGQIAAAPRKSSRTGAINPDSGLKPKDLIGQPWALAFALRADGWWLRSAITWCKKSPMPESTNDRPTSATEMIFLLAKSEHYYYDSQGFRETKELINPLRHGVLDAELPSMREAERASQVRPGGLSGLHQGELQDRQGPLRSESEGPGNDGRPRSEAGCEEEAPRVQPVAERQGEQRALSKDAEGPGDGATGPATPLLERPGKGASQGLLPETQERPGGNRKKKGGGRAVQTDRARQGSQTTTIRAAQGRNPDGDEPADDRRMVGDPEGPQEPMPLLHGGEAADGGSLNPGEQGGLAYEDERGAGLPQLQRPQEQSPNHAPNLRNFWILGPEPFPEAHFATFVTEVPRRAVLLGTSAKGACAKCHAPWERVTNQTFYGTWHDHSANLSQGAGQGAVKRNKDYKEKWKPPQTSGWQPTCECNGKFVKRLVKRVKFGDWSEEPESDRGVEWNVPPKKRDMPAIEVEEETLVYEPTIPLEEHPIVPCVVLDPFGGSGTTGAVARRLGRSAILIELNPNYAALIRKRCSLDQRSLEEAAVPKPKVKEEAPA